MEDLTIRDLLERIPPGSRCYVTDLESRDWQGTVRLRTPDTELFCSTCKGLRYFAAPVGPVINVTDRKPFSAFLDYICRNCRRDSKKYAVSYVFDSDNKKWVGFKFGEEPGFGPPVPARVITLVGPDRDAFLKGRRCEGQGLGVGAFAYYRRVVENQKARIFDEIIRVSRHLGADDLLLADLESAKTETQFSKAIDVIKHALPQSLLINGHNPLSLLHAALSEGVHDMSDEECLELAGSVRAVLVEFADRLGQAMKDEAELNTAVNRLARKRSG